MECEISFFRVATCSFARLSWYESPEVAGNLEIRMTEGQTARQALAEYIGADEPYATYLRNAK